jgi:hypothetical protein
MILRKDDALLSDLYSSIYKNQYITENSRKTVDISDDSLYQKARENSAKTNVPDLKLTPDQMYPIEDKLTRAKRLLRNINLEVGLFIDTMRIRLTVDPRCPTMGVDALSNLYININFLMKELTVAETAAVLAHEALHVITHTFPNELGRLRKIWNFATDYIMNSEIIKVSKEKLNLPEGCIVPLTEDKKPYDGKGTPYLHFWTEDRKIDIMIPMVLPNGSFAETPEQVYDLIILAIKKKMEEDQSEEENEEENDEQEDDDQESDEEKQKGPPEEIKVGDIVKDRIHRKIGKVTYVDNVTGKIKYDAFKSKKEAIEYRKANPDASEIRY